jgi:hypothetical protein
MSLSQQIEDLIEQEVSRRVNEALSKYADMISKSYKIPLSLLLRDIPEGVSEISSTTCLGLRAGNKRCKMSGKYDGYCRHHFMQHQKTQPVKIHHGEVQHTHGIPPLFQDGCPACVCKPVEVVAPVDVTRKQLIDFKLVK